MLAILVKHEVSCFASGIRYERHLGVYDFQDERGFRFWENLRFRLCGGLRSEGFVLWRYFHCKPRSTLVSADEDVEKLTLLLHC